MPCVRSWARRRHSMPPPLSRASTPSPASPTRPASRWKLPRPKQPRIGARRSASIPSVAPRCETAMFETILTSAMRAMPTFALQLGVTLAILVASVLAYRAITPMDETKLIKEGNIAAATAFGAAILSLALPLGTCLARSVSIPDIVIWGAIACAVQLGTFFVARFVFRDLVQRIERGETASAIALGATHLGVAVVNAAAIAG
ncbi:MAG: DUF350 domain-containing protein [Alphaproteobacteria bacterium]|nr:DUF350 domain-containing protein [Alphaproteobacteria bacterium]